MPSRGRLVIRWLRVLRLDDERDVGTTPERALISIPFPWWVRDA